MAWAAWAIPAAATLVGAYLQSQSTSSAASQASDASRYAAQVQKEMYEQSRQDVLPQIYGAQWAANRLPYLLAAGPGGRPVYPSTTTPDVTATAATTPLNQLAGTGWKVVPTGGPIPLTDEAVTEGTVGSYVPEYKVIPENYVYDPYSKQYLPPEITYDPKAGVYNVPEGWTPQTAAVTTPTSTTAPTGTTEAGMYPMPQDIVPYADYIGQYEQSAYNKWLQEQGLRGIQYSAAARGALDSGATLKAMAQYSQNIAGAGYQDWLKGWYQNLNAYASIANPQAGLAMAQVGQSSAANQAAALQQAGAYQAAGTLGTTNALLGGFNQALRNYMDYRGTQNLGTSGYNYNYNPYSDYYGYSSEWW